MATEGVLKYEIPKENIVNITFDNKKTSIENILAALAKGGLTVNGKPVLINK
jgi:hypothetical protein